MLLSIDWDYFSGCIEHVFDAPIWGTADTAFDRVEAWQQRAKKRKGKLSKDFPLFEDWTYLLKFSGIKTYAALSHADAYDLLESHQFSSAFNLDSHHDLFSLSGDPKKVRPGNWAGLALEKSLIKSYTCCYPEWHKELRVTEGYDLDRSRAELPQGLSKFDISLERKPLESLELDVECILLVQSPAWTNPEHDVFFFELCKKLRVEYLTQPLDRRHLFNQI